MKILITVLLSVVLCLGIFAGCAATETKEPDSAAPVTTFRIASLKGPTTMGMVKLMKDSEGDSAKHNYQFEMFGTADEVVPKLVNGELDIALLPCNLASILYNRTEGAVQVAAINTLGVLYIVESGDTVHSIQDLAGKTVYSTGKGTTPEFALNYILNKNGIEPGKDINIEYKSEATEIAAMLKDAENTIAVLPQPYVTAVQMQNEKVRVALSLTEEWDKVSKESSLVTGVVLVRKTFAEENALAFSEFLDEYKASTEYVNANVKEAAVWVESYGIVAKAPIAVKAIPACNITYIEGDDMKAKVSGYLEVLFNANPKSVGGALPKDDFYFNR
ncbi:MAG: ABC transporter substrate-binding protein [Anaerolineaceae bacterium]|jgi:NitT/TauT family transport system substrate-binding protein